MSGWVAVPSFTVHEERSDVMETSLHINKEGILDNTGKLSKTSTENTVARCPSPIDNRRTALPLRDPYPTFIFHCRVGD